MRKLVYSALLIGLILVIGASECQAEEYLGEFCWRLDITTSGASTIFKSGVYEKEGGHYVLYGKSLDFNVAIHGNAERYGSNIVMTFVMSGVSPDTGDKFGNICNAVLDASTLNGTFYWVGTQYSPGGEVGNHYDYGTMTLITCP